MLRERAVYLISGHAQTAGTGHGATEMWVLEEGVDVTIEAEDDVHLVLIGGDPLDGTRHIWWNFVASDREAIERAKEDWRHRRFPLVPGDEVEFVPLPGL